MRRLLVHSALLIATCASAHAATSFCVDSAASLQAALTQSQADGDDDYIYLVAGTYAIGSGLAFASSEPYNLILAGGWDAGCNGPGGETLLDGQHAVRPLQVAIDAGNLLVQRITFIAGRADAAGAGLAATSESGNLNILMSQFVGNRSSSSGGALHARSGTGNLVVFGNLAYGNRAAQVGGMLLELEGGGEARVVNNTIVANIADLPSVPGGLVVAGGAHFAISNNILWNNAANGGSDFGALAPHSRHSNDIGVVASGTEPDAVSGELSVNPRFEECGGFLCIGFEPARDSPLVDAGDDLALADFGPGLVDLAFLPRTIGPHVDIGAYENEALFADGFEP